MSVARNTPSDDYCFNITPIRMFSCERDLEALVSSDHTPRARCVQSRNRANRILGFISKSTFISIM